MPPQVPASQSPQVLQPKISLAVLCYRTEDAVIPFVEKMHAILSDYNFPWELVLVANYLQGIPDRTPEVVANLCERLPHIRHIALEKKGMMGWDMRTGLEACRGEYLGVVDGDGQFPHEAINACIGRLLHDEVDLVKTYRVLRGDGWLRRFLSFHYNLFFRILFPQQRFFDINSKPKFIRRSAYRMLNLCSDGWFIDAEIMIAAARLGLRVAEIPIHFNELRGRHSFVRLGAILEFLKNLWEYRFGSQRA
ncbi:MAG: glycosyltransferase family 2 protein [Elusimicrobia bacterium]|nr:glycosyltransferase family 2 protein [Elusimicrobiota bacterium]